ncbi:MAG: phenylalanine--tRNA ligase subunit alpha [Thermoplasmatales archaeon]|nr:phenylalanine--tRNA ligase subunit alpha [Thermoplasmatales archaeon]
MEILSPLEKQLLIKLADKNGKASIEEIEMDMVKAMNAVSWLQSKGLVITEEKIVKEYSLTPEGEKFLKDGLPEKKIEEGEIRELEEKFGKKFSIMLGWALKKGWCEIDEIGDKKYLKITNKGKKEMQARQVEEEALDKIKKGNYDIDEEILNILKRREAIKEKKKISRSIVVTEEGWEVIRKGIKFEDEISQLTPEMLKNGSWREKKFRKYDIRAFSPSIYLGKMHPLTQIIEKIRKIFSSMGFKEIKGSYVESSFWNMDILFIPQDHPARDMQDTFYCRNPSKIEVDEKMLDIVAEIHESGGKTGSKGWGYKFNKEEAKRAILRTHTTVNTIRYLINNPSPPAKVFSIEKVFRRENIDATHLPEFHQIEGIVYEEDANFCMLKGILREFYSRIGFENIRFRPSYFPYTEPSMEIEVELNGKWIEVGGSGIFRPEVTEPFGIKYPVLAWGLGLERIAMNLLGLNDIRMLYFSDIGWLRSLPLL